MKAIILNNGGFILTEGIAPYFIKKKDFLNFLTDKDALKQFIGKTPLNKREISPLEDNLCAYRELNVHLENNYERLGFYEYYGS